MKNEIYLWSMDVFICMQDVKKDCTYTKLGCDRKCRARGFKLYYSYCLHIAAESYRCFHTSWVFPVYVVYTDKAVLDGLTFKKIWNINTNAENFLALLSSRFALSATLNPNSLCYLTFEWGPLVKFHFPPVVYNFIPCTSASPHPSLYVSRFALAHLNIDVYFISISL